MFAMHVRRQIAKGIHMVHVCTADCCLATALVFRDVCRQWVTPTLRVHTGLVEWIMHENMGWTGPRMWEM